MRPMAMALLTLLSLDSSVLANAEHDPPPQPEQPVPAAAVEAFESALQENADLLDALYLAMRAYNPGGDGKMYSLSLGNALETDWIQQTPNVWGQPLTETADKIKEYVQAQPGAPTGQALRDLLCTSLHLAPLRFGSSDKWPNGWTFANHAKFFMIDDSLFYVGSENFYKAPLQEYGVFLNDANAASQIKAQYWDRLWQYSSQAAISGNGPDNCHFK